MGRPKVPLLSRDLVLNTALRLIDEEGLECLSIRRLADELSVNGASLYHHFSNKDEIVVGAAELALERTPIQPTDLNEPDWRMWITSGARQLRDLLLAHPHLIPIIVRRRSMGMADRTIDMVTRRLMSQPIPSELIIPMLDALEQFIVGTALRTTALGFNQPDRKVSQEFPALSTATADQLTDHDTLFDAAVLGIVDAITALQPKRSPRHTKTAGRRLSRRAALDEGATRRR